MRRRIAGPVFLALSIIAFCFSDKVSAQIFTTLHTFAAASGYPFATNSEGALPGRLILSGDRLYGATQRGGRFGRGTLFGVNLDGTGFTNLHSFTPTVAPHYTNDGASALVSLSVGDTIYGFALEGGPLQNGTIFAVKSDGSGFTNVYNFPPSGIAVHPFGLVLSGNIFYGAASGGSSRGGTIFQVNADGTGFSLLYDFAPTYWNPMLGTYTNSDGILPRELILSGNTLYGTAQTGGGSDRGTVFRVNTDGTGFATLHSFGALDPSAGTNADGANPLAGLSLSGNSLYGTASGGGTAGNGTVFKVNTDGTGFTTLHSFTRLEPPNYLTNSDGASPFGQLVFSGNVLYGTAPYGGRFGRGTVFAVNTDGSEFVTLHHFRDSDGSSATARLVLSSNTLYGTAGQGGSFGNGTVFSLSLPRLAVTCPQPLILECTNGTVAGTVAVDLEYSGSNSIVVVWNVDGTPYQTNNLPPVGPFTSTHLMFTANFASGDHRVTVSASNGITPSTTCSIRVTVLDLIPPTLSCPPNQTLEFSDAQGAVANYSVSVNDLCDPMPFLTCAPAGGSIFAFGETTVQCFGRDASGNSNTCSFTVTVLGARGTKYNRVSDLVSLLSSITDHSDRRKLERAITHLINSLDPRWWVDEVHVTRTHGTHVFGKEILAVRSLCALSLAQAELSAHETIQHAINRILQSDRLLVAIAIRDATGANVPARKIARADQLLQRADRAADEGDCGRAVQLYRRAWTAVR
jgi:uncharacterized repeat protein (TIGR03803 family)